MAGKNLFNSVKMTRPNTSVFDLSHDVKLSCNAGYLVPTLALECVPGDKFRISCESLLRFAPLVSPVMHRMDVTMHYFFVPNRILWPNWEKYITNTKVGGVLPAHPYVPITQDGTNYTLLADYMGIPDPALNPGASGSVTISPFAFAAYQKIYNEYYRDQNLSPEVTWELIDGTQIGAPWTALSTIRRRSWEHDYFTAALPFAQKGDTVDVPLGDVILKDDWGSQTTVNPQFEFTNGSAPSSTDILQGTVATPIAGNAVTTSSFSTEGVAYNPYGTLTVEATTINDLRTAFRLQEWLEKNARGGTRYIESNLAHFGVRSSDKRLQRPEYITGTKSPVVISEVLNTTGTDDAPQGNMAGHGVAVTSGQYGGYYCEEHGYIIGIMSVMPKTAYFQGVPRHFLKFDDPTQYYWPSFANLGEQAVLNQEIYAYDATTVDEPFGYVPRYAEYKFLPSRVAGDFRSTLDFWHWARKFDSTPALNDAFIQCNPDARIFAVEDPDVQKMYVHIYHKISAVRPMPKYGTPSF